MSQNVALASPDPDEPNSVEDILAMSDSYDPNAIELANVAKLPSAAIGVELGVTSPLPSVGSFDDFYGISTDGEIPRTGLVSLDELILMTRKDGQARALLRLLTLPILSALKDAEWIAPDDTEEDGTDEVEFANMMWTLPPQSGGMSNSLSRLMRQTLLAISNGFSCFEEVRHVPESGPLEGMITLRKLALRDARTIKFKVDDHGGFNGFVQRTSINGKTVDVWIKPEKAWYYAVNEEENPFYGVSMFEAAWQHYDIKRKLYYIAHLAAQFAAVPARVGEVPPNFNLKDLQAFKQALADFATNTAMTHPFGYKVEMKTASTNFDFLKLIDHQNHMMSRSVLCGFIDSEDRPALVDISKGDPQADMFVLALESIMNEIAESWSTHVMPKYIDWNFGTDIYPVFKFGQLSDESKDALKEAFVAVVTASTLNCTPEFVREVEKKLADRLGLDINYEEIESMEADAAAANEEKAQLDAEMQAEQAAQPPEMGAQPPAPGQPAPPAGPQPPQLVAATHRHRDIDELVSLADDLLKRHLREDLNDPSDAFDMGLEDG